ncbi:MAG: N-acetyl sugar amidotransferase [Bacteroidota bacterium]
MPLVLDAPAPVAKRPPYAVPQAPFAAAIRGEVEIERCSRCLYDATIPNISFDDDGVCNYCRMLEQMDAEYPNDPEEGPRRLQAIVDQIKAEGRGKQYDVIVGVSGGCDSSYMIYQAKQLGLRPLAVHFDNTWNSTIATENIHRVLKALDVDLYTYVVDNEEYDDIYRSFLEAGVPDVEAPTDIGLATVLYMAAAQHGIRYMLEGHSFRTEGVFPLGWLYFDGKYIQSVHKQYGTQKMKTYPNLWLHKFLWWTGVKKIKKIRPLYFMDYQKEQVKAFLESELDWQWYGGHHLENRFTNFYHTYLLPTRFGIDSRIVGYAAQVRSGHMSREEGEALLCEPPSYDPEIVELVQKRLGYSADEFHHLMTMPKRRWTEFKTYKQTFERMRPMFKAMYKLDLVPKSFYVKYTSKNNI